MVETLYGVNWLGAITAGLSVAGVAELAIHRRNVALVPWRVHVNGTRGKSSVTRLIAAGLRQAGVATCAKTTGTLARMILPDGREVPIFRPSHPNILEQKGVVAWARSLGVQALVVECMALQPALQWLSESKLINATHGVITNVRPDHLDVMGPHDGDVALALCGMVPPKGKVFTAEQTWVPTLAHACHDRGAQLQVLSPAQLSAVSDDDLRLFAYDEHRDNVALALAVCADLGVSRDTALSGMARAQPDPGALTEHQVDFFGRRIVFVNGFAANDPVSTERIWRLMVEERHPLCAKTIAIFNCRADRAERSVQLGHSLALWPKPHHVLLMGDGTYIFARAAAAAGVDFSTLIFLDEARVEEIFETVVSLVDTSAVVMGLGNIGGKGLDTVRYFKNRTTQAQRP